jgi:hypothetical protein
VLAFSDWALYYRRAMTNVSHLANTYPHLLFAPCRLFEGVEHFLSAIAQREASVGGRMVILLQTGLADDTGNVPWHAEESFRRLSDIATIRLGRCPALPGKRAWAGEGGSGVGRLDDESEEGVRRALKVELAALDMAGAKLCELLEHMRDSEFLSLDCLRVGISNEYRRPSIRVSCTTVGNEEVKSGHWAFLAELIEEIGSLSTECHLLEVQACDCVSGDSCSSIGHLGRRFLRSQEARAIVRHLKMKILKEWQAWSKSGRRPSNIPARPDQVYRDDGWISWMDWLEMPTY